MKRFLTVSTLFLLAVSTASPAFAGAVQAGVITAGNQLSVSAQTSGLSEDLTAIAVGAPVTGDGALDSVTFGWSAMVPCATVKIKVFRFDGTNFNFVGERGPFAYTGNSPDGTTASLSPAIGVQKGDWLGITNVNSGDCGNAVGREGGAGTTVTLAGDVTSTESLADAQVKQGFTLALFATGFGSPSGEVFAGVLPGAGSGPGAQNSHFKTGIQATNPYTNTIHGRLAFHPAGASASDTDPSLGFSLDPGNTSGIDDIVAAMGLSGLCSIDVYIAAGDATPVLATRVFNDAGAAGTTGFTEPLFDPSKISGGSGQSWFGVLITPPDNTRYRYNVGIRTIGGPVGVSVTVKDPKGNVVHTFSTTYPFDSFTQLTVHDFLGGFDPDPNDSIVVEYSNGQAIIYGATTDNVTNDPSVQFMLALFGIA